MEIDQTCKTKQNKTKQNKIKKKLKYGNKIYIKKNKLPLSLL